MEQDKIIRKLEETYKQIEKHLEEGVTYYATPTVTTFGTSGGQIFSIENDIRKYIGREKNEGVDLFDITTQFPAHTIVKYTFKKGSPITVEACSPEMLIGEMKLGLKAQQMKHVEMLKVMNEPAEDSLLNIETHVKFLKKGKLDIVEKQFPANGKMYESDYSSIEDEIKAMYQALDGQIKKMFISLIDGELTVQTTPEIPGLTSEVVEKMEDLTLDETSLQAIYAFMESHVEVRIAKAVEVLQNNPAFIEKAEKRYLNFVRARLNDATASLAQFPEAALQKSEVNILLGKHFAKDFISFSYFDDSQSKLAVDFIGSLVQNAIDLDEYAAQAIQSSDVKELIALYDTYAKKAKAAIVAEAKIYSKGWYSQVSSHLIKLKLKRILFEKTQFDEANRSLALKAFVFFFNVNASSSVYLDVFQSDEPKLTEMFWLLKSVPESSWGDTAVQIPNSPLKFERAARCRVGDEGSWKNIVKP